LPWQGYGANGKPIRASPTFVWITGYGLCAPDGPCLDPATGAHDDVSEVSGLQGVAQSAYQELVPEAAFRPYPSPGPATPATGPDQATMVDVDVNADASGAPDPVELARNDATRVGDVAVYQPPAPKLSTSSSARHGGILRRTCPSSTIENVGEAPIRARSSHTPDDGGTIRSPPADWTCETLYRRLRMHRGRDPWPGETLSFEASFVAPLGGTSLSSPTASSPRPAGRG
jgi:hypothetical protein